MIKFYSSRTRFSALPGARADRPRNGTVRQRNSADQPRRGDAALVSRLRHERDRGPRAPRRARRPEAGPPPGAVRDARGEQHLEPAVREVRAHCRRSAGQVPPARRHCDLRGAGAHGAGLLHALHAGRRPGQFRLGGRRRGSGLSLYRMPAGQDRLRDAARHRQGDGRFHAQLRRQGARARRPADARSQPAGQRLLGHRRGHGDQHPAAQPRRSGRCLPACARPAALRHRGSDQADAGARFPDRRHHLRLGRRARGLPHGSRPRGDARAHALRGGRPGRPPGSHRRRAALSSEQEGAARAHCGAGHREEAGRRLGHPRRIGPLRHARGDRAQARRNPGGRAQQPVQADAAAGHLRHQYGGAGGRPAAVAVGEGADRGVHLAPPRSGDAARRLRPAQGPRARSCAGRPRGGALQRRRGDRSHQEGTDSDGGETRIDGAALGFGSGQAIGGERADTAVPPRRAGRELRHQGRRLPPFRRAGAGDPRAAAAAADRPRAGQDPRRVPRGDRKHRRPARHPCQAQPHRRHHRRRAAGSARAVPRPAAQRDRHRGRGHRHRGPDRAAGHGGDLLARRLCQVAAARRLPRPAPRRPRQDGHHDEGGRLHRAPVRRALTRLPAVLLQPRHAVLAQGVRSTRRQPLQPRQADRQHVPAGGRREDHRGRAGQGVRREPLRVHGDRAGHGEENAACRVLAPATERHYRGRARQGRLPGRHGAHRRQVRRDAVLVGWQGGTVPGRRRAADGPPGDRGARHAPGRRPAGRVHARGAR